MPPVNVQDTAHTDPRLTACAKQLRISRPALLGQLICVWSRVTEVGCSRMRAAQVAAAIGRTQEKAVDALVESELAECTDDGRLDLEPLRSLYGDYEWYTEEQGRASAGGRKRAAEAERASGRFVARDWDVEIPRALSELGGQAHIAELATALGSQRKTIRPHLARLVDARAVTDLGAGRFARTQDIEPTKGTEATEGTEANQRGGLVPDQRLTSALAPAPTSAGPAPDQRPGEALAPAPTSATSTTATPIAISTSLDPAARDLARARGALQNRQDAAWKLAQRHDEVGHQVAHEHGLKWRTTGTAGPRRWGERLMDGATVEDCEHVLAILAAEADERAVLGVADPLRYLRTAHSRGVFDRTLGFPDEDSARESARAGRPRQGGQSQLFSAPVADFGGGSA